MQRENNLPVIGREYSYSQIDGELCHVRRTGLYSKVRDGKIIFSPKSMPYGFLEIECKKLPEPAMLLITHREDYLNVWKLFEEASVSSTEEMAVIWSCRFYKNRLFKLTKAFMPKLWVLVFHRGYYDFNKAKGSLKSYRGSVDYTNFISPIRDIKPEVME